MSRRAHRRAPTFPKVYLSDIALQREVPAIRRALVSLGVRGVDLDDLVHDTLLGAWTSMQAGRFTPDPKEPLARAIRLWLNGIAHHVASHYHDKAYRRHEIPTADPWAAAEPPEAPSVHEQVAAREALRAVERLPPILRKAIFYAALDYTLRETSEETGRVINTVWTHRRRARLNLRAAAWKRRWRRP